MTAAGLRERKKEKTRDALVHSALQQFAERGFERVTVEEITAACDVSPRTFFRYFGSKEDVLFATTDAQKARFVAALREQPVHLAPLDALEAAVLAVAGVYVTEREMVLLRHRVLSDTPSLRSRIAERHHTWEREVAAELGRTGRAPDLSAFELRLTIAAATTALRVATDTWIEGGGTCDLRALLVAALDHLREGLGH